MLRKAKTCISLKRGFIFYYFRYFANNTTKAWKCKPKMTSKSYKNRFPKASDSHSKKYTEKLTPKSGKYPLLGPKTAPRGGSTKGPRTNWSVSSWLLGCIWPPDPPQVGSRLRFWPPDPPPSRPRGPIFNILRRCWNHFSRTFGFIFLINF